MQPELERHSVSQITLGILRDPWNNLIRNWNWKAATFSASFRSLLFLIAALRFGRKAASAAMLAEFVYAATTAGFYAATTQAYRTVEPRWKGTLICMLGLPALNHTFEFLFHSAVGTRRPIVGIILSICFTMISTLFSMHVMRQGAFLTGPNGSDFGGDLKRLPTLIGGFVRLVLPKRKSTIKHF